ncbi:MAG: CsbD family protein [Pseudomonadota bacterium]|nr:CsbD family protein [Pseudomonadota bacterium]
MKHEELKGKWNQLKGKVKEQWGELTGDDIDKIDGRHDQLVGRIQERYGKTRETAEREVEEWSKIN